MTMRALLRFVTCFAVMGGSAAATEVRITFTESRGDLGTCSPGEACDGVSLSEVRLFSGAAALPIESITNPGGYNPFGEGPSKLIDDLTAGSKWLDLNFTTHGYSELIIVVDDALGAPTSLELVAGNTPDTRDPVSWTVEVRDACGGLTEVASVTQAAAPVGRWSPYPVGPFALNMPTLTAATCSLQLPFLSDAAPAVATLQGSFGSPDRPASSRHRRLTHGLDHVDLLAEFDKCARPSGTWAGFDQVDAAPPTRRAHDACTPAALYNEWALTTVARSPAQGRGASFAYTATYHSGSIYIGGFACASSSYASKPSQSGVS